VTKDPSFRFTITMHSEDQATHKRMAALADALGGRTNHVSSRERAEYEWEVARNTVTFAFRESVQRDRFREDCATTLGAQACTEVARSDSGS
jgi:hypothetical protein